ncbi:uncharacterized protein V6R79_005184 [Siganus canaliculatus]
MKSPTPRPDPAPCLQVCFLCGLCGVRGRRPTEAGSQGRHGYKNKRTCQQQPDAPGAAAAQDPQDQDQDQDQDQEQEQDQDQDHETTLQSSELQDRSHGDQTEHPARRQSETNSNSRRDSACSTADCEAPVRGRCSNRAQKRPPAQDRVPDPERDQTSTFNRTKAPEMASCVRSGDCAAGLCCVRYLTGRRCQRIPAEGEACLLRGFSKQRRKLGRCDCHEGLACAAVSRADPGKAKGQGVCVPRQRQAGQRKTRHSGKKRRTPERSC